jgi:hypothetical protein
MTSHTYPPSALLGDYLRAAAGFLPAAALLVFAPLALVAGALLGALAATFAVFGIKTALRQLTRIEMSETMLEASAVQKRRIPWAELDHFKLAFYSTELGRRRGWMQLSLKSRRSSLRLDSRIEGFERVVRAAAEAAARRRLPLDAATRANLEVLGLMPLAAAANEPE